MYSLTLEVAVRESYPAGVRESYNTRLPDVNVGSANKFCYSRLYCEALLVEPTFTSRTRVLYDSLIYIQ